MEFSDIVAFFSFLDENIQVILQLIPATFAVLGLVGIIYVGFQFWRTGDYSRYKTTLYRMLAFLFTGIILEYIRVTYLLSL